jgi:hypothetical protein
VLTVQRRYFFGRGARVLGSNSGLCGDGGDGLAWIVWVLQEVPSAEDSNYTRLLGAIKMALVLKSTQYL